MKQASHQNTNTLQFHLYEVTRVVKLTETESRTIGIHRGLGGGGNGERRFNGYRVSLWGEEKVLAMDGGDDCTIM